MKMDDVTQQNTALVEEAAAAAESLMEQADELINTVAVFQLDGNRQNIGNDRRVTLNPMRITSKPVVRETESRSATKAVKVAIVKSGSDDGDWEEF
jgi:methyl-accepting chemotaxis protein